MDRTAGAVTWRKAARSTGNGGNCVELAAFGDGTRAIRDSKDPGAGHLTVDRSALRHLLARAKSGDLDIKPGGLDL
jgi:hypothetical protein